MSQAASFGAPRDGPATPAETYPRIDDSLKQLLSTSSAATAPASPEVGTMWADTSISGSVALKMWSGTAWIALGTFTIATGLFQVGGVTPIASGGTGAGSPSAAASGLGLVGFAYPQSLSTAEREQATTNIGATPILLGAGQPGNAGILMQNQGAAAVGTNGDVAGSLLRYAVFTSAGAITTGAAVPSGTWRNISEVAVGVNQYGTFRRRT